MIRGSLGTAIRLASYAVAVAASGLLATTISQERLVAFGSAPAALAFGLLLGGVLAAVAPLLNRVAPPAGCFGFAVVALALGVLVYALVGTALPGFRVTFAGSIVGGVLAMLAAGAVFSLLDERPLGEAQAAGDD